MTAKNILEKHFNCLICQEQLSNPRRLVCGHVYCHGCLDELLRRTAGYYWIRRGTVQVFGFKCPECRKVMRISRPEDPPERWVLQIPRDFKLDGILADLKEVVAEEENGEKEKKQILTLRPDFCQILETVDQVYLQHNPLVSPPRTADYIHKQASVNTKGNSLKIEVTDKVEAHGISEPMMLAQNGASRTMATGFGLRKRFKNEKSQGLDFTFTPKEAFQDVIAEDEKEEKKKKQILTHRPDYYQIMETVDELNLKHDPLVSTADYIHTQASVNTKGNSLKIEVTDKVEPHGLIESMMLVQNGASRTMAGGFGLKKTFENEKSRSLEFSFTPEEAFEGNWTEKDLDWDQKCP